MTLVTKPSPEKQPSQAVQPPPPPRKPETKKPAPKKSERSRPTQTLPTERIAFTKQLDLLRVYASASGAAKKVVTLAEVESIIKMKASTVSLTSAFFTDTGLLLKTDKGFIPSDAVMNFQRAHAWNPETASHKLAPAIQATWFAQRLLPKLSFRPISEQEAVNDLAEACAASPDYEPQLKLLLDYMAAAGLIVRDGDHVRTNVVSGTVRAVPVASNTVTDDPPMAATAVKSSVTTAFAQPTEGTIQFHVSVKVDMAEFAGWRADRITAFFSGIAQVLAAKGELEKNSTDK